MSRLIDDRGRLFGKVSVVDIVVLAVIVALAVFVGLRVRGGGETVAVVETRPVTMTFAVKPAYDEMVEAYTTLGELTDKSGRRIGDIEKVEIDDRSQMELSGEDMQFFLDSGDAPIVLVEVSAQGRITGDTVRVGPMTARVGSILNVIGPGWEGEARLLKVDLGTAETE